MRHILYSLIRGRGRGKAFHIKGVPFDKFFLLACSSALKMIQLNESGMSDCYTWRQGGIVSEPKMERVMYDAVPSDSLFGGFPDIWCVPKRRPQNFAVHNRPKCQFGHFLGKIVKNTKKFSVHRAERGKREEENGKRHPAYLGNRKNPCQTIHPPGRRHLFGESSIIIRVLSSLCVTAKNIEQ